MSALTRDQQLQLVAMANRAPSVHNTQPARWRFSGREVLLFEDVTRRLAVGDPEGRDALTSLGAALEGLHLALGDLGLALTRTELTTPDEEAHVNLSPTLRCRARAWISEGSPDPLADVVSRRRSYRATFDVRPPPQDNALEKSFGADDITLITSASDIRRIAELNDAAAYGFMRDPAYRAEVREWMRLSPSDERWHRDGLTADCLAMSGMERVVAGLVFQPTVFAMLHRLGISKILLSEAPQTASAAAIAVLHRPATEAPLVSGRRFYRFWLELTRAGYSACPMSSLSDSPAASQTLRAKWNIPPERKIVNVFRIGVARERPVALSPRLPPSELLV